jgi:hypothetical protein
MPQVRLASLWVTIALAAGGCASKKPDPPAPVGETADERRRTDAPPAPDRDRAPLRPKVEGKPGPSAVCGHAVAVAGWGPAAAGDSILLCDPADNRLQGAEAHDWRPQPRRVPVHYGRRRPSVVLLPAAVFTVMGAVVVTPTAGAPGAAGAVKAAGMPDLTQHLDPRDGGLCGPTSAADVLFAMSRRHPEVVAGLEFGPSTSADVAATKLIRGTAGSRDRDPASLAGRMGIAVGGAGATNKGIRDGLAAWLNETAPGPWRVALDWFDDEERSRSQQQAFFGKLAAAIEAGGGAILCLWPGGEFADAAVSGATQATVAETPAEPPVAKESRPADGAGDERRATVLPGRPAGPGSAADAARIAEAALREARRRLAAGKAAEALDKVGEAIEAARPHATADASCRAQLEAGVALAREVEPRIGPPGRGALQKPTVFE